MKSTRTSLTRLAAVGAGALLLSTAAAAQTTQPTQPPAASLATAAPSGPWSLRAAVDYALQNNLGVRQGQLSAQLTDATLRLSRAALLPTANLNGTQAWNFGTSIDPLTNEFKSQTIRSNNFSASTQVTLFSGFQLRNIIKRNVLDYEASLSDVDKARNDLALNVAASYLQLVLAQELVRTNQLRVNTTQQQLERTRKLLKAGSVAESNLLDSQSQLASDELNVITAQNQVAFYQLQLMQYMNIDPAASPNFQIDIPDLPDPDEVAPLAMTPDATYQTAQGLMPEVKAADLRVQSAIRNIEVSRGAYLPRLFLNGSLTTGYSSARSSYIQTGIDSLFVPVINRTTNLPDPNLGLLSVQPRREFASTTFGDQLHDNFGKAVQFNLQVPILNGLQARVNVQRSQVAVKQAELRAEQTRLQLRQSIQQAYSDAIAAQRKYGAAKRQVEALTTSYRNAEIRFNNGLLNGTEFNISKNNLSGAESGMLQAKYEFIFRRKVLDFYEGRALAL